MWFFFFCFLLLVVTYFQIVLIIYRKKARRRTHDTCAQRSKPPTCTDRNIWLLLLHTRMTAIVFEDRIYISDFSLTDRRYAYNIITAADESHVVLYLRSCRDPSRATDPWKHYRYLHLLYLKWFVCKHVNLHFSFDNGLKFWFFGIFKRTRWAYFQIIDIFCTKSLNI